GDAVRGRRLRRRPHQHHRRQRRGPQPPGRHRLPGLQPPHLSQPVRAVRAPRRERGGREYVRRIVAAIAAVGAATPAPGVDRRAGGVWLRSRKRIERFDEVVFACHSDQTLALLGAGASADERRILGAVRYQPNLALVHTDPALLPRRRKVWSAWNYLAGAGRADDRPVSVSYLINRLQPLPFETPVVVSLNPFTAPAADKLLARIEYSHPVFDEAAIAAQGALPQIQGRQRSWFAGAWTAYGFHEDGLKSA